MRDINAQLITETVARLFIEANTDLPLDVRAAVGDAFNKESSPLAKSVLHTVCENIKAADEMKLPICQDTGMAVLFVEIGQECHIVGNSFEHSVNEGVRQAYIDGYLRKSVVSEPLYDRKNTSDNTPAIIHTRIVDGERIKITALPKGFGSENMSVLKMFTPSATEEDIISFVADSVKTAGGNPCPPVMLGVGIGGDFEYCAQLAKKALARDVGSRNPEPIYAALEEKILKAVNETGVGAQGFGGDITALGCCVEYYPTHIAGLPVALNINCHVIRHKTAII